MIGTLKLLFSWVLFSSIGAGIIAGVFILARMIFGRKVSPRVFCLLWLLVIARLIIAPFAPESRMSMFNLFSYGQGRTSAVAAAILPQSDSAAKPERAQTDGITHFSSDTGNLSTIPVVPSGTESGKDGIDLMAVLAMLWFSGLVILAGVFAYSFSAFGRTLKSAGKIPEELLPEQIRSYMEKNNVKIEVFSSLSISNPCINGIVKPRIYLPRELAVLADESAVTHILMHEIAHYKRKDYLTNILVAAVNTVHWFNPVIWIAMKLFSLDREMCCDSFALETLGEAEAVPYGMTLLNFSKNMGKSRFHFSTTNFYKSENQIRRRILMMRDFKKGKYKITAATVALCVILGLSTLTNAAGSQAAGALSMAAGQQIFTESDPIRETLGNSKYMYFNTLSRATGFTGFDFKVPDYLPEGFKLYSLHLYRDEVDSSNLLNIDFWSTPDGEKLVSDGQEYHFTVSISKGDLLAKLKSYKDSTYDERKITLGGRDVTDITVHSKRDGGSASKKVTMMTTVKHMVWQDAGIWYDLEYFDASAVDNGDLNVYENLPQEEIGKTIASMTATADIKKITYSSSLFKDSFSIYDKSDLKDAENLLGFTPKFPLHLTGGLTLNSADISGCTYFEDDTETPFLVSKYNVEAADKTLKTVEFDQTVLSSLYNKIVNEGYMSDSVCGTVNVAGIDMISLNNGKEYAWTQNGVYYYAIFQDGIENQQAVLQDFITK